MGVLVSGFAFTALAALWLWEDSRTRDRERFTRLVEAEWTALETRIEADERVLKDLAGYFDERAVVNTNQWRHRLELISPQVNHSELAEIGFALEGNRLWRPLPPHEAMAGGLEKVPTERQGADLVYFPVLYSWRPDPGPRRVYGEGVFTDPVLNEAFGHSYKTMQPGMTPPYPLWRDAQGQPVRGVTLMLATFNPSNFEQDAPWLEPATHRRGVAISGVVFLSWRMDDLFRTVLGEGPREVALEIFDGMEPLEERRWNTFPPAWLRSADAVVRQPVLPGRPADEGVRAPAGLSWRPAFTTTVSKANYGGKVLVRAHSTPWFDRQSQRGRVWLTAGAGSLLSMALAGLVFVQTRGRARAEALSGELAESRELLRRASAERERLSRDLHDGTVQSLYAVGLGLGRVRRGLDGTAEGERIEHALVELDEVVAELRRFLVELDPGVSPVQRPETAVGELVARMRRASASELSFTVAPGFRASLRAAAVLDLLQTTRESASNALRHGRARRVEVFLRQDGDRVRLEVRDDGDGFDPAGLEPDGTHGLDNLRHRAEAHGGRLEVVSRPGGPTMVAMEIPADG